MDEQQLDNNESITSNLDENYVAHTSDESHEGMPPSLTEFNDANTSNTDLAKDNGNPVNNNSPCIQQDHSSASRSSAQELPDRQVDAPRPTKTKTRVIRECSSNECILIPKHAVNDDTSLKFILHPNLPSNLTSNASLNSCSNITSKTAKSKKPKSLYIGVKKKSGIESPHKPSTRAQRADIKCVPNKSLGASTTSTPASGEQFVIKTAKEILYDIAKGKWNREGMVYDEETEGTKKFGSEKPCSNANCVRAAERDRRQKDRIFFEDFRHPQTIFEDGNLPSYHSLLNLWRYQEDQKQRYTWLQEVFKHGFPQNEAEFLKVWRECRKNPQAFGIRISEPGELPEKIVEEGSRVRKVMKPYDRNQLVAKFVEKQKRTPPVRLAGREYYNPDYKPVKDMREREKLKKRYEGFRKLYPHLPILRDIDYRMNPLTVKHRMKQAEEWHKLVTASNKPLPMFESPHYAADIKNEAESPPGTAETSELDFSTGPESRKQVRSTSNIHTVKQK